MSRPVQEHGLARLSPAKGSVTSLSPAIPRPRGQVSSAKAGRGATARRGRLLRPGFRGPAGSGRRVRARGVPEATSRTEGCSSRGLLSGFMIYGAQERKMNIAAIIGGVKPGFQGAPTSAGHRVPVKREVATARCPALELRGSLLDQPPVVKREYAVRPRRGQRALRGATVRPFAHSSTRSAARNSGMVKPAGGLVEHEHVRILHESPSDGEALPLRVRKA